MVLDRHLQDTNYQFAASPVNWELHTVDGQDLCRVSAEPADFEVHEDTDPDEATFWWRYPTGTKAIKDPVERDRIIGRRFGRGGGPTGRA